MNNIITTLRVFTFRDVQYRAKFEAGLLKTLCTRLGPNHAWRKVPAVQINSIWIPYMNERNEELRGKVASSI